MANAALPASSELYSFVLSTLIPQKKSMSDYDSDDIIQFLFISNKYL